MISLQLLGGLTIAFLLGFATHALALNFVSADVLKYSTAELVNFVLSVLLSGASIFLAIAAIALGRFSEQSIVQRSDESIRLQNEVFQKTTDALQRIESSTGVTEKRLEDIISGRVGDISQKIARIATEKKDAPSQDIEEVIRKSLYQALRDDGIALPTRVRYASRSVSPEQRDEHEKEIEYDRSSSEFLKTLALRDDVKAVKLSRGRIGGHGDEMYDGIFLNKDGAKIGIVDFAPYHSAEMIARAIPKVCR